MMMGMMGFMVIGMLLCFVVPVAVILLLARWLNKQQSPTMQYTPVRQHSYAPYEQGYSPREQSPEIYLGGWKQYHSPQPKQEYDQPQGQYPQEQELPWQH
jgi:hypothetical protein